jgi:hypothetical protein
MKVPTFNVGPRLRPRSIAASLALASLVSIALAAIPGPVQETDLKAAALYNIIAFTDWPESAFSSAEAPLVIGVLGQTPITTPLARIVAKETRRGRPLTLLHVSTLTQAKGCHVLFLASSEMSRWRASRDQLSGLPILTVSDADKFAEQGGAVQFAIELNRLHLNVNLSSVRASGLTISSKVLRLAHVIDARNP